VREEGGKPAEPQHRKGENERRRNVRGSFLNKNKKGKKRREQGGGEHHPTGDREKQSVALPDSSCASTLAPSIKRT
jgi:hypothetical protein